MQELRTAGAPGVGTLVQARGEEWIVAEVDRFETCDMALLRGRGSRNAATLLRLLTPFDCLHTIPLRGRTRARPRRAVLQAAARAVAGARPAAGLWTAAEARLDLLPWQLEPALAVVDGATRVLLADAVGLGKTVQAALIAAELLARGLARHVLILTPAGLRAQWARELDARFTLDAVVVDHDTLTRDASALPPSVNPWAAHPVVISSIDLVKRAEQRIGLDDVPIDLLIVDEAHHLAPGTERGAAAAALASRAPWVVLATATPPSGDAHALAYLRGLGDAAGGSSSLVTFRRSAAAVGRQTRRRIRRLVVRAEGKEAALLAAAGAYTRAIRGGRGRRDRAARLVALVLARRAASSPAAFARSVTRRAALLGGAAHAGAQPALPWDDTDAADAVEADAVLGVPGFADPVAERAHLDVLLTLAMGARRPSAKLRVLERLLARTRERLVVFTEYRDTAVDVAADLSGRCRVVLLHGGLGGAERRQAVSDFAAGRARVLVATDTASEGLNLQAGCRLVVHFDLPWSPLRLEQREGRVDRLGQTRPVHVIQLRHAGSVETQVLARLLRRAADASAADLGETHAHAAAAVREAGRLGDQRRLALAAGDGRGGTFGATLVSRERATRHARSVMVCFEAMWGDDQRLVERASLTLVISRRRGDVVHGIPAVEALVASAPVRSALAAWTASRTAALESRARRVAAARAHRLAALESALRPSRRAPPVQTSLFDRRARLAADARADVLRQRAADLARRRRALDGAIDVRLLGEPRLVAAWPAR